MMITSINIRNLYSFGDKGTPELKDFNQFNLLIGKNGCGKSSVINAICDLRTEKVGGKDVLLRSMFNSSVMKFFEDSSERPERRSDRNISLTTSSGRIRFVDGELTEGDYLTFQKTTAHIASSLSFDELKVKTNKLKERKDIRLEMCLSFMIYYIFGRRVTFHNGGITEVVDETFERYQGRHVTLGKSDSSEKLNSTEWASGFTSVANVLADLLLLGDQVIVCADEPEANMEPRACRRLMSVLVWLCSDFDKSDGKPITQAWFEWLAEADKHYPWLSQMENDARIPRGPFPLRDLTGLWKQRQLFVTSHSPAVINCFIDLGENAEIYEFGSCPERNEYVIPNKRLKERAQVSFPTVSTARHVATDLHTVLDGLGAKGADLLQCNGVVWVEGPSDTIYIRQWLKMHANENGLLQFTQGIDYEFQMFGGTLLSHLRIDNAGTEEASANMVSMFSFSRNVYVVIDSDDGESKFESAKKRIAEEWDTHAKYRPNSLGLWYDQTGRIRTVEDYITDSNSQRLISRSYSKVRNATDCVQNWDSLTLADFHPDLQLRISDLYSKIAAWVGE